MNACLATFVFDGVQFSFLTLTSYDPSDKHKKEKKNRFSLCMKHKFLSAKFMLVLNTFVIGKVSCWMCQ